MFSTHMMIPQQTSDPTNAPVAAPNDGASSFCGSTRNRNQNAPAAKISPSRHPMAKLAELSSATQVTYPNSAGSAYVAAARQAGCGGSAYLYFSAILRMPIIVIGTTTPAYNPKTTARRSNPAQSVPMSEWKVS